MSISFHETIQETATRLQVSYNFARIRLALLKEKLGGQETGNEIKWGLRSVTATDLRHTLQLDTNLNPVSWLPETDDLAWGRLVYKAMQLGGLEFGGQGLSRTALAAPYGYEKRAGKIIPVQPEANAVTLAFGWMVEHINDTGKIGYREIADGLNRHGYVRKNGQPFTGDSLRDWPRTPSFAGFVKRGWRDVPYVEPFPDMKTPIVPLRDFVIVAQNGREAGADWVRHLAEYLD